MDSQRMLDFAVFCTDIVSVRGAQEQLSCTEVSTFRPRFIFNGTDLSCRQLLPMGCG